MDQQELVRQAKAVAGGSAEKLAAISGWRKSTIDGWSAPGYNRTMPNAARIMFELLVESSEVRELLIKKAGTK